MKPAPRTLSLVEKYRPHKVANFIGLSRPKALLGNLLRAPRACSMLFLGPPGTGKSTMALAFTRELNAALISIPAAQCNLETVEQAWEAIHYFPPAGKGPWWVIRVEEADKMSSAAQLALCSHMDSTSSLSFEFCGSVKETTAPPVIFIFTANGGSYDGTAPPALLEPRFLSRCLLVPFSQAAIEAALPRFLSWVWTRETGKAPLNGAIPRIAKLHQGAVRDALQALEVELMVPESKSDWTLATCDEASWECELCGKPIPAATDFYLLGRRARCKACAPKRTPKKGHKP